MHDSARSRTLRAAPIAGTLLAAVLVAGEAPAEPIALVIDPNQSSLTLGFDILGIWVLEDTAVVSGMILADLQIAEEGGMSSFEAVDSNLAFTDMSMFSEGLPGETLEIMSEDTFATLAGGPAAGTAGPTDYDFDIGGFALDLDAGMLTITTMGTLVGNDTTVTDLSVEPVPFTLARPTSMELTATDLGGGTYDIEVLIPIDEMGTLLASESGLPADVDYSLMGPIVATGILTVPEPGVLLQLACGLGLLPVLHRVRQVRERRGSPRDRRAA